MHVISTAGHVDHGKSTLIERITGIDPDRLAEEKARGLTIELGFAWMRLPSGSEVGFVDVPGHERFIHNMLAGVGSVDATLFVVAADEGWMPQSAEHLAILEMLEARTAVVALTKADLVPNERIEEIAEQVREQLAPTALADSPIVAVSATTGAGIQDLLIAMGRMVDRLGEPLDRGRPRMFLDRVFTVKGVGTVATGTLTGGSLRVEEHVIVLPAGHRTRVRGIQSHKRVVDHVEPVRRVALNLAGLERAQLARGDAVVLPGQWEPTTELDVVLRTARGLERGLSDRGSYKTYLGASEVDARIKLYDLDGLEPGGEDFARITLGHPIVAAPFDRFVVRDTGRRQTVGGGIVLDAHPTALRGSARAARVTQLQRRTRATPDEIPALVVAERGIVARADLAWMSGSSAQPSATVSLRTLEVSEELFNALAQAIGRALAEAHERLPLLRGIPRDDVRVAADVKDPRLFAEIVDSIGERVVADGPLLRLATHTVVLSLEQEAARDVVLSQMEDAGFKPPGLQALIDTHGEPLVRALLDAETLVKIADDIVFTAHRLEEAKRLIAQAAARDELLTASHVREVLDTSRKFAIPLLEFLDASGFTRRRGDVRELV
jgi:selenocysteine-specific elongation factor